MGRERISTTASSSPRHTRIFANRASRLYREGCRRNVATTTTSSFRPLAGDDRDTSLYHWSSERFSAARKAAISVLVAKGRARVGVAASIADWPERIRDLQFLDHEGGYATATYM